MTLKDITDFINAVGFPIAVTAILLWRFDTNDRAIITALNALTVAVNALCVQVVRSEEHTHHEAGH